MSSRVALLALMSVGARALVVVDAPPVLSSPVFSLATLQSDGRTNMNMVTYASPVGIRPNRVWAISLYRGTQTHTRWIVRRTGVLQQLCAPHAPLTYTLGGTSGAEVDKAAVCAALGFVWQKAAECDGDELVLPGCRAYYRLVQQGELISAGDHDVAICRVDAICADEGGAGEPLSTAALREAGLITSAGRAVPPEEVSDAPLRLRGGAYHATIARRAASPSARARRGAMASAPTVPRTLEELISRLSPLGPTRAIAILPGGGAILEASSDSAAWDLKTTEMPSGKTLLTAALPDKSFELHVDVAQVAAATLGTSAKTGGPVVRLLNAERAPMLTLLPSRDCAAEFGALADECAGEVVFAPRDA